MEESTTALLSRESNQALGLGHFAIRFLSKEYGSGPSQVFHARLSLSHC